MVFYLADRQHTRAMLTFESLNVSPYAPLLFACCLVEHIGKMALAAVLAIVHSSHEDTSTTLDSRQHIDVNTR